MHPWLLSVAWVGKSVTCEEKKKRRSSYFFFIFFYHSAYLCLHIFVSVPSLPCTLLSSLFYFTSPLFNILISTLPFLTHIHVFTLSFPIHIHTTTTPTTPSFQ